MKNALIFLLLIFSANLFAQNLNLSFNHLTRQDGLSNNNATSLLADSRGFLWIGTHNGLNRFDGSVCKTFKPYNSNIKGVSIANLIEDKNGDLWFTSETGLNQYIRKKNTFENYDCIKDGSPHQYLPFYIDNQNKVWFSVLGKGIFTFNPQNKKTIKISPITAFYFKVNNIPYQEVKHIYYSETTAGLGILKVNKYKIVGQEKFFDGIKQPSLKLARYFFIENDSTVWLTGNAYGLIRFNLKTKNHKIFKSNNEDFGMFTSIAFQPNSAQLYLGSNNAGITIFDTQKEKFIQQVLYSPSNLKSIKANWVEDIIIDKNLNLFVSLMGWGVDFSNLKTLNTEQWLSKNDAKELKLKGNEISYSFIHKNRILLKLQQGGLIVLNTKGQFIRKIHDITSADNLFYDNDSTLYACGEGEILIFDDNFYVKQRIPLKTKDNSSVKALFGVEISEDELIISTMSGFFGIKKQGSKYTSSLLKEFNSASFQVNQPLYYDKNTRQLFFSSNWWNNFYIFKKKEQKWEKQNFPKIEANILNIVPDPENNQKIWLCTNKGLWKFDIKTYQYETWDEAKGLPDNSVTTMIPLKNKDFWLITNRGISYYNAANSMFKNFSEKDGATSSEYDWYGNFKLPNGKMMFAGTDGITVFNNLNFQSKSNPKIYIEDIKVNEKSISTENYIGESLSIVLNPKQNSFSLDFAAIDYKIPADIKLQYKLEKYDNLWVTIKNPATVHYSNVTEGNYNFLVRLINNDGTFSTEKSLGITVQAPFWRTSWFRLLLILSFLGLLYAFYRFRINQILKLQAVRNRISNDLHDDIGASLSGIGILSTVARQQLATDHPVNAMLSHIAEDVQNIGSSIDDIVWSINPQNDELSNIVARINRNAAELLDAKKIEYQILIPQSIDDAKLTMEQRRDVYLIYKEAINNLIKYAECNKVLIQINIEGKKFKLIIKDDGKGFDIEKPTNRNGLRNMKNRAKNLNGILKIDSNLGGGTIIYLEFQF